MKTREKLEVTTPTEREIVVTRLFDAPRHLVFRAFTEPALLKRWLNGPPPWALVLCEIDLKVGGRGRYEWRGADGSGMGMSSVFREIVPPERIVHTELFDEDWTGGETTVTTVFTEKGGKTTMTQTILYVSQAARDGALKMGMTEGMDASFNQLDELLGALG